MFQKLTAMNVALVVCFTALYVVLGLISISPIIGLPGKTITAAAITAPIIGLILGPYLGAISTILGGTIGFFEGSFSLMGFFSGIATALSAGLLYTGKRIYCILLYSSLLIVFGFYPFIGAFWLFSVVMWFEVIGFLILISPLQSFASKNSNSNNNSRLLFSFFITSLVSTLAGQIAGSITFTFIVADVNTLKATWQVTTFLYPVERIIITLASAFVVMPLVKVLKTASIMSGDNHV